MHLWINGEKQRMRDGGLKGERLRLLREVGIDVETYEEWKSSFDQLADFAETNGRAPSSEENKDLFTWWQKQIWAMRKIKNGRSGLNEGQISLLKKLTKIIPTNILLEWD